MIALQIPTPSGSLVDGSVVVANGWPFVIAVMGLLSTFIAVVYGKAITEWVADTIWRFSDHRKSKDREDYMYFQHTGGGRRRKAVPMRRGENIWMGAPRPKRRWRRRRSRRS